MFELGLPSAPRDAPELIPFPLFIYPLAGIYAAGFAGLLVYIFG